MNYLLQQQIRTHFSSDGPFSSEMSSFLDVVSQTYDRFAKNQQQSNQSFPGIDQSQEQDLKKIREEAEALLVNNERRFRALVENGEGVAILDQEARPLYVSPAIRNILGYTPEEAMAMTLFDIIHPDDVSVVRQRWEQILQNPGMTSPGNACRILHKNGNWRWIEGTLSNRMEEPSIGGIVDNFRDITDKIYADQQLRMSEERYRYLFQSNPLPMWIYCRETLRILEANDAASAKYGFAHSEFLQLTIRDLRPAEEVARLEATVAGRSPSGYAYSGEWTHQTKSGELLQVEISSHSILFKDKDAALILANDITERKKAQERLSEQNLQLTSVKNQLEANEARLKQAQTLGKICSWEVNFQTNIARWSDEAYRMYGVEPVGKPIGPEDWLDFVHPDDLAFVKEQIDNASRTLCDFSYDHRIVRVDGTVRYVYAEGKFEFNASGAPTGLYGIVQDITDQKRTEQQLKDLNDQLKSRAEELAASNAELERFAYVASHDLQEPLRMVSSFLQLLQRKYEASLDERARQYIGYAVDGAERMKRLILDLLEYSRVGTNRDPIADVPLNEVIHQVRLTFREQLEGNKAILKVQDLPVVRGERMQMIQLLQNLVGNALKYNKSEIPVVNIGWRELPDAWEIFVNDNGIGIDAKYFQRVFAIFQRLHNRSEFSGTGVGLAICKKIVERHGGAIWVESKPGEGSTFFFTIRK